MLAAALRIYGLGSVFPVNDEFQQFFEALHPSSFGAFLRLVGQNPHHLLLDALTTYISAHFGTSLFILRLPSAIWGTLAVWLLAKLGEDQGRPMLGLGAAFLLAISLLHIDWSRRCDFYALLTLLSIWSAREFLKLVDDPARWKRFAASCLVFVYAHPYFVLMFLAQLAASVTIMEPKSHRRAMDMAAVSWTLAGMAFAPWFFYSAQVMVHSDFIRSSWAPGMPTWPEFFSRLPLCLGQAPEAGPFRTWDFSSTTALSAAYLALYAVSLARTVGGKTDRLMKFAHLSLPVGAAAVVLLDLRYSYYAAHRQLLWLMPFYLLAVCDGAQAVLERLPGAIRHRSVSAGALAALALWLPAYSDVTSFQRGMLEGHERVVAQVAERIGHGEALVFRDGWLAAGFLFFYDLGAFQAISDQRIIDGQLSYVVPDGLLARRDGAANVVVVQSGGELPPSSWLVSGSLYELSVTPPR